MKNFSYVNVKDKFDEYKNKINEEFNLYKPTDIKQMDELEKELENIDILSK